MPLERRHSYPDVRGFADVVAAALARAAPERVTAERSLSRRHGVYLDTKMNGHGQQIVAPYSVRPLDGGPVATPLRWEEVTPELDPGAFTIETVAARVAEHGDLLEPLLRGRQRLAPALAALG